MHCKSLWIKVSAKCINVNVTRQITQRDQFDPGVTIDFKCSTYTFLKMNCVISTLEGHQTELQEILSNAPSGSYWSVGL